MTTPADPDTGPNEESGASNHPSIRQRVVTFLTDVVPKLGSAASVLTGAALLLLVVVIVWRKRASAVLVIEQLTAPQALVAKSLSTVALTHDLADLIDSVKQAALPSAEQRRWRLDSEIAVPDVEVPLAKAPLPKLVSLIDEALGRDALHVTWEIGARGGDTNPIWVLSAHMPGRTAHEAQLDLARPRAAIAAIARGILSDVEPLILARALLNDHHCEDARIVAVNVLRREALTPHQRSAALNLLGLAADCTDVGHGHTWSLASRYFRAAIEDDPDNPLAHANLGAFFASRAADPILDDSLRRAALDSMGRAFRRASELAPRNPGVHEAWGRALVEVADPAAAIAHLDSAIADEPRLPLAYLWRANAHHQLAHRDSALSDYVRGLARDPDNLAALKGYGHELILARDWLGASGAFERAARLDTADFDARFYYGCALRHVDSTHADSVLRPLAFDAKIDSSYRIQAALAILTDNVECRYR
jgi:Tfp pilus assembly protein PilF